MAFGGAWPSVCESEIARGGAAMEDSGDESVSFNVADYVRLESEGNIRKIYVVHDIVGGGRQAHHKLPLRTCLRSHLPHEPSRRRRR